MKPCLFLLFAVSLQAQIAIGLEPMPRAACQRLFGKRPCQVMVCWSGTVLNRTDEPVAVTESAILRTTGSLRPYSATQASLIAEEADKRSPWARAGRLAKDFGLLAALIGTNGTLKMSEQLLVALAMFNTFAPYLAERLQSEDIHAAENFRKLAFGGHLELKPGDSDVIHLFTAPGAAMKYQSFAIEAGPAPRVRLIQ